MKNTNSIIIVTLIATFVFTVFAFQPTVTEASNNVSPSATPSPRRKGPKTIQSPKPVQSPKTIRSKASRKSAREAGSGLAAGKRQHKPLNGNVSASRTRKPTSGQRKGIVEVYEGKGGLAVKSARQAGSRMATGKRQHKPVKGKNLGDTGTHEVGHKQRRRKSN